MKNVLINEFWCLLKFARICFKFFESSAQLKLQMKSIVFTNICANSFDLTFSLYFASLAILLMDKGS